MDAAADHAVSDHADPDHNGPDIVRRHVAMLEDFLREAVQDFGRGDIMARIAALRNEEFDFGSLSESEAAHAARIMTCMSALSVIAEDVG